MNTLDMQVITTATAKYRGLSVNYSFYFGGSSLILTVRHAYDNSLIAELWHDTKNVIIKEHQIYP